MTLIDHLDLNYYINSLKQKLNNSENLCFMLKRTTKKRQTILTRKDR